MRAADRELPASEAGTAMDPDQSEDTHKTSILKDLFAALSPLFGVIFLIAGIYLAGTSFTSKTNLNPRGILFIAFFGICVALELFDSDEKQSSDRINQRNSPPMSDLRKDILQGALALVTVIFLGMFSYAEELSEIAETLKGDTQWQGLTAEQCRNIATYYFTFGLVFLPLIAIVLFLLYRRRPPLPLDQFENRFFTRLKSGGSVQIPVTFELPRESLTGIAQKRIVTATQVTLLAAFRQLEDVPKDETIKSIIETGIAATVNEIGIPVLKTHITGPVEARRFQAGDIELEPDSPIRGR